MLDEVNQEVFLDGWVAGSVNAWRRDLGGTLLLALVRFGLNIDKALKQVNIAKQNFVADGVSATRLSARDSANRDVVQPLALSCHRDIQLERGSRNDPDRHTLVLMEKVGEAVCLV
jgi:hypothetical protein